MVEFDRVLKRFQDAHLEFIIVGGAAAWAQGLSLVTQDLDVVYGRNDRNIERLVEALAPFKPRLRGPGDLSFLPFQWDAQTVRNGLNFTLTTELGDIDVLGEITPGGTYEQLLPFTISLELFGVPCKGLSLEKLAEIKRAVGRHKDLYAVSLIEALLEEREMAKGDRP